MTELATFTPNPTIDIACEVERLVPTHKLRASGERHDPGGGGINVARVYVRLGGDARCVYLAGGAGGQALDGLLDLHLLVRARVPIRGETRMCTTVRERASGLEYRFVPEGPEIAEPEWRACLDVLAATRCRYLVASGSLPRGMPDDFYARVAAGAAERGQRFVLDSSGRGLASGLAAGGVFLVKPSLDELASLAGHPLVDDGDIEAAALALVARGAAELVAVTMGARGALLASAAGCLRQAPIPVVTASAVGAGDSFLAAMVHALVQGWPLEEACRFGNAAGAAAAMTPGTDLAPAAEIHRLYAGSA